MADKVEIRTYIGDMIALERHILNPVEAQLKDDDYQGHPEVRSVLNRLQTVLQEHILHLEHHLEALGGHPAAGIKSAVSEAFGAAASAIQGARKTNVSKSLRDDHVALSLACVGYEMLYTTARVTHAEATSKIALQHLEDLAVVVMKVGRLIPDAVIDELLELDPSLDGLDVNDIHDNIRNTWHNAADSVRQQAQSSQYVTV